jgi:hypothetical protein
MKPSMARGLLALVRMFKDVSVFGIHVVDSGLPTTPYLPFGVNSRILYPHGSFLLFIANSKIYTTYGIQLDSIRILNVAVDTYPS